MAVGEQDLARRAELVEPVVLGRRQRIEQRVRARQEVRAHVDPDLRVLLGPVPDAGCDLVHRRDLTRRVARDELGAGARGAAPARGAGAADGRRPSGSSASTPAGGSPCGSGSSGCSTRAASTRRVRSPARATYDDDGELRGFLPANMVVGQGRIDGRRAVVQGDDFTVRGGAADAAIWQKMVYAERMAHDLRLPLVRLVDGTGGGGSVKSLEEMGFTYVPFVPGFELTAANLSLGAGGRRGARARWPASARRAWWPRTSRVIVEGTAQLFVAGPPVVAAAMGETPDKEELGGARMQARAGAVDNVAADEDDALDQLRRFLSYLPGSVWEAPPIVRVERSGGPARGGAAVDRAARAPAALRRAAHPRARVRPRLGVRARARLRRPGCHGARPARRPPGGRRGERPEALRRRADRRRLGEAHALRGPVRPVPAAVREPRRPARAS